MFAERCILPNSRNSFPNWYDLPGAIAPRTFPVRRMRFSSPPLQPVALFSAQIA